MGLSELHHECGDWGAAAQHLERAKALGERAGLPENRYRWRITEARLAWAQGDLRGASAQFDEAERLEFSFPTPNVRPTAAWKARLWIAQERLSEALAWTRERGLSAHDDLSYLREFEHVTLARLLLALHGRGGAEGALLEATDLIERLLRTAEEGGRGGQVIELSVLKALAHQAQGDADHALTALEQALALAEPAGYVQIFVDEGESLQHLLRRAAAAGRARSYARRLLSILEERHPPSPDPARDGAATDLVQPLTPRETEIVRLIATGMANREIADDLFISTATVKRHVANIYGKLDVRNRTEAAARVRVLGLL